MKTTHEKWMKLASKLTPAELGEVINTLSHVSNYLCSRDGRAWAVVDTILVDIHDYRDGVARAFFIN